MFHPVFQAFLRSDTDDLSGAKASDQRPLAGPGVANFTIDQILAPKPVRAAHSGPRATLVIPNDQLYQTLRPWSQTNFDEFSSECLEQRLQRINCSRKLQFFEFFLNAEDKRIIVIDYKICSLVRPAHTNTWAYWSGWGHIVCEVPLLYYTASTRKRYGLEVFQIGAANYLIRITDLTN